MRRPIQSLLPFLALVPLLVSSKAAALDKQGSAHGGQVEGPSSGMEVGGQLLVGAAIYNPSYAARPDNTGLALGRIAPHFDFDLIGHRLSIPLDINIFTDGEAQGARVLLPSELDVISGLTSTWGLFTGSAIEFGARYERDMPVDVRSLVQSYADVRSKFLVSLKQASPAVGRFLGSTDLTLSSTLGVFVYNESYAARPDNSGLAFLRYAGHIDWSLPRQHLGFLVDTTFFTDRNAKFISPSELDLSVGAAFRWSPFEVSIVYERDMPVDQPGLVQQFVFGYVSWSFTILENKKARAAADKSKVPTAEPRPKKTATEHSSGHSSK